MARQLGSIPRGRVVWERIDSRVLRNNRLGDPHVRDLPVYLPPGYDAAQQSYPVLVALAGFTGRGAMMLNATNWGEPLNVRLDRLQAEGKIGPMIVAMPDCFTRYGGSQYVDSSAVGRYETHLVGEIVPHLDRTFRTLPSARHRGVFGKSSGGYGALVNAMRHPDVFGAVACHSGDMAFEYCYLPDFPKFLQQMQKHGGVAGFLKVFEVAPRKTGQAIEALSVLAMAACYAPEPRQRGLGFALPVDLETGALDPVVWARWLEHDPLSLAPRHRDALRRLRLLFIDCGSRDEYNLQWGARQLSALLRKLHLRHIHEEFDDGHRDITYRFDRSLPLLWQAVRPQRGTRKATRGAKSRLPAGTRAGGRTG